MDLVPKFIMAGGDLVRMLVYTDVTKYLEFKSVDGSYVLNRSRVEKVPASDWEALKSPLLGLFEKRRAAKFFSYCASWKADDPSTWQGKDPRSTSMQELYKHFGLDPMTVDFVGHAVALWSDDGYLLSPALETVPKVKLYYESMQRYEGLKSPYMYPLYGLGELPQAFARLSAVHGGTYMLSKSDAEVVYDPASGRAVGVRSEGQVARARVVIGDPSYFPTKTRVASRVVRAFCVLSHPVPATHDAASCQIILPQKQTGRKHDIYVFCCSKAHCVSPEGKWIALVSTTVETDTPAAELAPGLALLGTPDEVFTEVVDVSVPLADGAADGAFISRGFDATSHFETEVEDVLDLYKRITGRPLDLSGGKKKKDAQAEQ